MVGLFLLDFFCANAAPSFSAIPWWRNMAPALAMPTELCAGGNRVRLMSGEA